MGHYDCKSCDASPNEKHSSDCERFGAVALQRQGNGQTFDSAVADRHGVKNQYTFNDKEIHLCWACGSLPCDWGETPWGSLPWIVTLKESSWRRFLIDRRDAGNPDMFSGYVINALGSIGDGISLGTGSGGRLNLHRTHFIEELPQ